MLISDVTRNMGWELSSEERWQSGASVSIPIWLSVVYLAADLRHNLGNPETKEVVRQCKMGIECRHTKRGLLSLDACVDRMYGAKSKGW